MFWYFKINLYDYTFVEYLQFKDSNKIKFERLKSMLLSLKETWAIPRIRAEANSIENSLLKTTQKLMNLERQYRFKKMEFLARIEAYEEKLKWVTAELE